MNKFRQFDVWYVDLNLTIGSEINKIRPCVIISPKELNWLNTLIVAPLTTKGFNSPSRVEFVFNNKTNLILLDQLRTVDKKRFIRNVGYIQKNTQEKISQILIEMFSL